MDKKGDVSFAVLQSIPRIIFLVVVLFSIVFLIRKYAVDNLDVQDVQAEVFINRILYSSNGILYADKELNTALPGIVDVNLLKNDVLDQLMNYRDDSFIAAKIRLLDSNGQEVASAIYNNQTYYRWLPIANINVQGKGGVKRIEKSILVQYTAGSMTKQGFLNFEVLQPGN